jgi:hypothetical protein
MNLITKILLFGGVSLVLQGPARAMPVSELDELYSESIYGHPARAEVPRSIESGARTPSSDEEFDALSLVNETTDTGQGPSPTRGRKPPVATRKSSKKAHRN